MDPDKEWLEVDVVYALPQQQTLVSVRVKVGTTVIAAVEASGILARHPEIELPRATLGVFGKRVMSTAAVQQGDRIEIYRGLRADPKRAREARALRQKAGRITR